MQNVDGYPTDLDVVEPSALVIVNGVPQEAESLSVTRELSSNLPAQVTSASGITAATSNVLWNVGEDVQERSAHPWDGNEFPPKPSDDVIAYMGYGDILVRQLTGIVDGSAGSIADGSVSSDVVDPIDKLNVPVTFPAFMGVMPPHEENGPFLLAGSEPTFFTDRVLRACGFYATPPMDWGCVLSVPLMGSAWPERGRLDSASQQGYPTFPPSFDASHWGMAVNSIEASYAPDISSHANGYLDKTFQITVKARKVTGTSGSTFVRAYWGAAHVTLVITAGREIQALLHDGSAFTHSCHIPSATAWSADTFTVRLDPAGSLSIYTNNGETVSTAATIPNAMATSNITSVRVSSPHITGMHIGGVQAGFSTAETWTREQTATLTPVAHSYGLPAFPRIDGRNALEVLKEQAEAECAAMWLDEHGHFRWVNRDVLTGSEPVATLTALDDVLDIGWESSATGVRSKVLIASDEAIINRSDVSNQKAWQGGGGSLDPNQTKIEFATPESDVDWIDVDETMPTVTTTSDWPQKFNWGHGSWTGGIYSKDATELWANLEDTGFLSTIEKVGLFAYKITTHAGVPPADYAVEQRTPAGSEQGVLYRSKLDFHLPILRAKAVIKWVQRHTTGAFSGPADAAVLEHTVGPWVQDPNALRELADWLAMQVSEPRPVLRDLTVVPDFRRQLGDVVWVEDPENMRIRLKLLITKISTSVSPGNAEQTVGGQILEARPYGVTNAQLDQHAGNKTNAGFDTLWADATNAQLDADPLGRG